MNRSLRRCLLTVLGSLACIALSVPLQAATTAGRVVFVLGQPKATDSAGADRALTRGDEVYSGDSLATAARERLQVSMVDGAFISVQPGSTYVIQEYVYSGAPDGTEQASYQLVKGGIRALTGLIGKSKPEAYKVNTAVATIGIRGTGHNTRLCQGDCGALPDGLYHNTWEGITFVENNVDSKDVPTGRGVYVKDINTMIEFQEQTPGVTAAVVASATEAAAAEEENEEPVFQQGEQQQVTSTVSVLPDFLIGIGFSSSSFFLTGDFVTPNVFGFFNGSGQLIGALGTIVSSSSSSSGPPFGDIRTIDLTAMQNGSDPVAAQIVNDIVAFAAGDSSVAADIALFQQNPASVAEFFADSSLGVGWGRWANGHVLTLFSDFEVFSDVTDLVNNQSVHFIYGPEPPAALPTVGMASYDFLGGTQSTSLSGATIGEGVTGGTLTMTFDFTATFGSLDMDVNHNSNLYTVTADLFASSVEFIFGAGDAVTTASGSACLSFCEFTLFGSFAGATSDDNPQFINFTYQIDETDPIIGVASFQFGSLVAPSSTVLPLGGFIVVLENLTDPDPDPVDIAFGDPATGFFNSSNQLIGVLFTDNEAMFNQRSVGTFDLDAVLGGDDAAAVSEVQALFDSSAGAASAAAAVAANPASVAEFFHDTTNGIGWGRWSNGDFLTFDGATAEVISLPGDKSIHFIFGNPVPNLIGLSSTATYNFIGGTQSTSLSGATIGNGVINPSSSSIVVDFLSSNASLNMTVDHGTIYNVSGTLFVDATDASMFDASPGNVTALSSSPTCSPCDVFIDAGFANPLVGGVPKFVGLEYDIQESDIIIGVAGFEVGP